MEIGTMSAQELAESFSNQGQTPEQIAAAATASTAAKETQGQQFQKFQQGVALGTKSSEEMAADLIANPVKTVVDNTGKTPEQIAEAKVVQDAIDEKAKGGRPKTKIEDSFKQGLDKLFKEQKLDPFSDNTETGYIVPETWEDVVELIDENKKNWINASKAKDRTELFNEILSTKSPAMKFLIENSETYKDPSELIPLLTAVQNLEYSNNLDPANAEDQVAIIRASLSIQGLSIEDIETEIEDLKERGKMETRASSLKPVLDRYNEAQTERVLQAKQADDQKKEIFWNTYYQNLEENVFKAKDIDGVKLKNEHKQLIASTLVPDEKLGGLPIYTIIDKLVAAGDFKKLSKIALLSVDEKLFDTYFLAKKADVKVEGIQRILRQSGTSSNTTDLDTDETKPKPIKKSQYGFFG